MKHLPKNTLAYFNGAPQTHLNNLSDIPAAVFSAATKKYRKHCGQVSPSEEAVTFYVLNHAASLVRRSFTPNEPLPEWAVTVMQNYTDVCVNQGERLLHYLLSITVREMRHLKSSTTATVWTKLNKDFGLEASMFLKDICSNGSEELAVKKYMDYSADMTVGTLTKAMAYAYYHGSWAGSYGGKMWGNITDALVSMLTGTTSMEMLVDTGYTLEHNTCAIFNKGMMYSHQDAQLATILDVQRAGEMLNLMHATETLGVQKTSLAMSAADLIKVHMPLDATGKPTIGEVDWKSVEASRPDKGKNPSKYAKVIGAQKVAKKPAAPKVTPPVTFVGKKAKVTGEWAVYPNQTVKIIERVGG